MKKEDTLEIFGYKRIPEDGSFRFLFEDNLEKTLKMKKFGITFTKDQLVNIGYEELDADIFFMYLWAKNLKELKLIIDNTFIKDNYNNIVDFEIIEKIIPHSIYNLVVCDRFRKEKK